MRIDENETRVQAAPNSLNPELIFDVKLSYQKQVEIPLEINGFLFSADGKKIANMHSIISDERKGLLELAASDSGPRQDGKLQIQVIAPLTEKAVDHLHTLRGKHPKGDVILDLRIFVKTLQSEANLSHLYLMETSDLPPSFPAKYKQEGNKAKLVYSAWKGGFRSEYTNMWIISGNNSPVFLKMRKDELKLKVTISSSDWVHDCAPAFQIGKFSVIEFYLPDYTPGSETIEERLNEAIKAVKKMEEDIIQGDWNQVIADSRTVAELLRNQAEFEDLFMRDGYTPEAFTRLNNSINEMFQFSSKFIHKLDQSKEKKIMPDIKPSKEDAYLIHALSISLVNLVSKKMQRLT